MFESEAAALLLSVQEQLTDKSLQDNEGFGDVHQSSMVFMNWGRKGQSVLLCAPAEWCQRGIALRFHVWWDTGKVQGPEDHCPLCLATTTEGFISLVWKCGAVRSQQWHVWREHWEFYSLMNFRAKVYHMFTLPRCAGPVGVGVRQCTCG